MHFVKREAVSEEVKNAEERRRAEKLKAFLQARDRILEKRKNCEFDEELMQLTGELLKKSPDIYTLWNIRREAIEQFQQKEPDETDEEHASRLVKLFDGELELTKECLGRNPKSYSVWHHRFLMVRGHPSMDLPAELRLCERGLTMDCRNFHCWDHRRSVAKLAELGAEEEIGFSDRLIGKNPSNYSAWHYRGVLLPNCRPNLENPEAALEDGCLQEEFEKVLHVCGVNSEDQTAWTYCRWLVEVATARKIGEPKQVVSAHFIDPNTVQLVFSEAVGKETVQQLVQFDCDNGVDFKPLSAFNSPPTIQFANYTMAHVWLLSGVPTAFKFLLHPAPEVQAEQEEGPKPPTKEVQEGKGFVDCEWLEQHFTTAPTCAPTRTFPRKCLLDLVKLCEELIPVEDIPWELAALTRAKLALDGLNEETMLLARQNCEKLKQIDSQRAAMYEELMDRMRILEALNCTQSEDGNSQLKQLISGGGRLVLRELGLHSISHLLPLSGLVRDLNLENNHILASQLSHLNTFAGLTHLCLNGNPIERLPKLCLPRLEFLSLARTKIRHFTDIQHALTNGFPALERLVLCETELASKEGQEEIRETLKGRNVRIIFHWM